MMPTRYLIPTIVFVMALSSISTLADVVILKNGKEFRVEKAWQEDGQIWIIFHGMRASIPPSKVDRIEINSLCLLAGSALYGDPPDPGPLQLYRPARRSIQAFRQRLPRRPLPREISMV